MVLSFVSLMIGTDPYPDSDLILGSTMKFQSGCVWKVKSLKCCSTFEILHLRFLIVWISSRMNPLSFSLLSLIFNFNSSTTLLQHRHSLFPSPLSHSKPTFLRESSSSSLLISRLFLPRSILRLGDAFSFQAISLAPNRDSDA